VPSPADEADGSDFSFTDRHGGVSSPPYDSLNLGDHVGDDPGAVAENRRRAAGRLSGGRPDVQQASAQRPAGSGLSAPAVAWMGQVHGREVAVVDRAPHGPVAGVDALVTRTAGLILGVLVADCVPVLFSGPGVAAVAHAGRKGLELGVVPATLECIGHLGVEPADLHVRLGPAACGACYEVPEAMRDEVAARAPAAAATTRRGTAGLDLRAGLVAQLESAGVRQIDVSAICTIESPDHYSYRREGVTGRFAGLVRCTASPGGDAVP